MILDLRPIEFMDSTGLRVLLSAHQRAHESGRRFALVRGADQVERVLTLTGVRDLLTVVDAPEELLASGLADGSTSGPTGPRLVTASGLVPNVSEISTESGVQPGPSGNT